MYYGDENRKFVSHATQLPDEEFLIQLARVVYPDIFSAHKFLSHSFPESTYILDEKRTKILHVLTAVSRISVPSAIEQRIEINRLLESDRLNLLLGAGQLVIDGVVAGRVAQDPRHTVRRYGDVAERLGGRPSSQILDSGRLQQRNHTRGKNAVLRPRYLL